MNDLSPDRFLEAEADRYLTEQHRNAAALVEQEQRHQELLASNPDALKAWERVSRGLPPVELACKFCPSMDAKDFEGHAACKSCVDGLRICRECGETEFIDGPEGPTMCVWCRSIDSEYSPDWEDS
jgi:hypothetical protein